MEIPRDLSLKLGAFIEPLAVGVHAVRRSGYKPGDRAVVFGAGPIGLCVASCLKYFGASEVIVVEANPYRLGVAQKLGCTTIDAREGRRPRTGQGDHRRLNADFAFDCAAHPSVQTHADGRASRCRARPSSSDRTRSRRKSTCSRSNSRN